MRRTLVRLVWIAYEMVTFFVPASSVFAIARRVLRVTAGLDGIELTALSLSLAVVVGLVAVKVRRWWLGRRPRKVDVTATNRVTTGLYPDYGVLTGTPEQIEAQVQRIDRRRDRDSERRDREREREAELEFEREKLAIRRSANEVIVPGTEIMSDGVPWVWDGEMAHARCPDHPDTNLEHQADGAGGKRGVPADGDSLVTDHFTGGHMICPKHAGDRKKLGGSATYGEARQRAEDAMRALSSESRPVRRGFVGKGGSLKIRGLKSRNLDSAVETEDTEVDAEDIDLE